MRKRHLVRHEKFSNKSEDISSWKNIFRKEWFFLSKHVDFLCFEIRQDQAFFPELGNFILQAGRAVFAILF